MFGPPCQDIERLRQDPRVALVRAADLGQLYLSCLPWHDDLEGSDVKGRNPFNAPA